jgi:5'-3' exonuclease
MDIHLVDGTYELFRHFYAVPAAQDAAGREIGAVRGVLRSVLSMFEQGATHVGVATDHVIESFRNELYAGYKTGDGVDPALMSQFTLLEDSLAAMGVVVWAMVEFEADDALAAAAVMASKDERVRQVIICTPDKDLGQCVSGTRVVQLDRRRNILRDEAGVEAKFGVKPESIPDFLAVVGDTADGFPGIAAWGEKGASSVLSRYGRLENIPRSFRDWHPAIASARRLATSLFDNWEDALLFRTLATLRADAPVNQSVDELQWNGPQPEFEQLCAVLDAPDLFSRAMSARAKAARQSA